VTQPQVTAGAQDRVVDGDLAAVWAGGPPFTTRRYLFLARASRVIMSKITVAAASAVTSAWS
jgi:hypothetical protein